MNCSKYTIGLDEVGRGPLAGPVAVGGVFLNPFLCGVSPLSSIELKPLSRRGEKGDWMNMITDSKKLNATKREYLTKKLLSCPDIVWASSFVSAKYINRYGIVAAIRKASLDVILQIIKQVTPLLGDGWEQDLEILLDGKTDYGLRKKLGKIPTPRVLPAGRACERMTLQTIVKGDSLIREIGAASIIAKVQRDQYMIDLSKKKKYQPYKFDRHKGYGTLFHRSMITQYGISDQHRKSFCRNIMPS